MPIAFGYHPYLRLPGVDRSRWELGFPPRRRLELDARKLPTGAVEPRPGERFVLADRVFDDSFDEIADGAVFTLAGGGRELAVTHHAGYPVAQVFSPPGAPFVCLEPMTAPTNALRTGSGLRRAIPGRQFTAAFSIGVGQQDGGESSREASPDGRDARATASSAPPGRPRSPGWRGRRRTPPQLGPAEVGRRPVGRVRPRRA